MYPDKISNGTICMSPIKEKEMKRTELPYAVGFGTNQYPRDCLGEQWMVF